MLSFISNRLILNIKCLRLWETSCKVGSSKIVDGRKVELTENALSKSFTFSLVEVIIEPLPAETWRKEHSLLLLTWLFG